MIANLSFFQKNITIKSGHLNTILVPDGEGKNLTHQSSKAHMPGGCPGGDVEASN